MSEFDPPRTRRERERVRGVQLVLEGMAARIVAVYEQPEEGVGYTDEPTNVIAFPEMPESPEAA